MKDELGWELLGNTARRRRERLGLTQEDVAAAGGPSVATLRLMEKGETRGVTRVTTLRALDDALGWVEGTSLGLTNGNIPNIAGDFPLHEIVETLVDHVDEETQKRYNVPVSRFEIIDGSGSERRAKKPTQSTSADFESILSRLPPVSFFDHSDVAAFGDLLPRMRLGAEKIIDGLAELSIDDLDKVIAAAHTTRNAKARELTKVMRLPWPLRYRLSPRERDATSYELRISYDQLSRQYMRAHEKAVRALARSLDFSPGSIPDEVYLALRSESETAEEEARRLAKELMSLVDRIKGQEQLPFEDLAMEEELRQARDAYVRAMQEQHRWEASLAGAKAVLDQARGTENEQKAHERYSEVAATSRVVTDEATSAAERLAEAEKTVERKGGSRGER